MSPTCPPAPRCAPEFTDSSIRGVLSIRPAPLGPGPFFCRDRVPATGAGLPAAGSTAAPRGPAWHSDTKCSPKWAAEHAPVTPLPDNGIALALGQPRLNISAQRNEARRLLEPVEMREDEIIVLETQVRIIGKVRVRPLVSGVKLFAEAADLGPRVLGTSEGSKHRCRAPHRQR